MHNVLLFLILSLLQNVQLRIKPIPKQLTFIPSALTTLVSNMVSFTVSHTTFARLDSISMHDAYLPPALLTQVLTLD